METNANSKILAVLLADAKVGTFTGLITTKKGDTRGRGADKKLYGNDQVHVVILTGFRYENLIQKSLDGLEGVTVDSVIEACAKRGQTVTAEDVILAKTELQESFTKTLEGTSTSTTDHVYDTLTVDGEKVRGSRVYKCVAGTPNEDGVPYVCKCRGCTGEEKAPLDGTIYLQGLQIFSQILTPAPNGPIPASNSAPKTVAKDEIRSQLPISRYVSYSLEKGTDFILNAGGTAAVKATQDGFIVTDEIVDILKKVA